MMMSEAGNSTRRGLLTGAIAILIADASPASAAAPTPETDAQLLHRLLAAELLAVAVYEGVLSTGLLSQRSEHVARRALAQERAHVRLLSASLLKVGGTAPVPPADRQTVDKQLADRKIAGRLSKLRTQHDCGSLLLDLESVVMADYFKAMSKLQDPGLQRLAAQIMANEAQHATAVSETRAPGNVFQAVPYAFAEGRR
jgi:Ferritin-like domain